MNQVLIKNWNNTVKKEDRIFVLGDFCLSGKNKIIEIGKQLNGRKTLILGNHDSASIKTYYEAGFEAVSKYPIFLKGFLLSHEPIPDCRFINIHGHIHNKYIKEIDYLYLDKMPELKELYYNVGVDMNNFKPVSFKDIRKYYRCE